MKKIKLSIVALGSFLLLCFLYNNFFLKSMIVGEYINKNFDHTPIMPGIPYEQDTLRLFDNNKYTSHFWKNGSYKISYNLGGTKIELDYEDKYGRVIFVRSLSRLFFGKPKLLLDPDNIYYLEKK